MGFTNDNFTSKSDQNGIEAVRNSFLKLNGLEAGSIFGFLDFWIPIFGSIFGSIFVSFRGSFFGYISGSNLRSFLDNFFDHFLNQNMTQNDSKNVPKMIPGNLAKTGALKDFVYQ